MNQSKTTRVFSVILVPEKETGGYTVRVPALRGCLSYGATFEEALLNVREAITGYLETFGTDEAEDSTGSPIVSAVEMNL